MRVTRHVLWRGGRAEEQVPADYEKEPLAENDVVNVCDITRQRILGFGGAFTDSAAYNYMCMSGEVKKKTLETLFGADGLKYDFCRIPMASSDFSPYMYDNAQGKGGVMTGFDINEDKKYKIPFIKDALEFTGGKIRFFASPWSPPAFMKDNASRLHGGRLLEKYYTAWADCFCRFIESYAEEGIDISAVTVQNEPNASQTWESCVYDAGEEAKFAAELKNAFKKRGIGAKILVWDHNKERLAERAFAAFEKNAADGAAFHWYSGSHFDAVEILRDMYPEKWIIESEFCTSLKNPGRSYAGEILGNLRCGANAITEWNLILDKSGGPWHDRSGGCAAPVMFDAASGQIRKGIHYYPMYMISHFASGGADALRTTAYDPRLEAFACRRDDGNVAVFVMNAADRDMPVRLRVFGRHVYSFRLERGEVSALLLK